MNEEMIEDLEKIRESGIVRNGYEDEALYQAIKLCKEQVSNERKAKVAIEDNSWDNIHPKHMEEYGLPAALTELAHGNAVYAICLDDKGKIINIDPLADLTIGEALDGYRFIVDKEL